MERLTEDKLHQFKQWTLQSSMEGSNNPISFFPQDLKMLIDLIEQLKADNARLKAELASVTAEKEAAARELCAACESLCSATGHGWESSCYDCKWWRGLDHIGKEEGQNANS